MMTLRNLNRRFFSTIHIRDRWHSDKIENPQLRRYGYLDKVKMSGPLPRLGNNADRIKNLPLFTPSNPFAPSRALFGQNDYIDILGHDELHPTKIMYGIPEWLRGFRGTYFQTMLRKKEMLNQTAMDKVRPQDWKQLNINIMRQHRRNMLDLNQRRYTNYKGLKWGPAKNHFKTRRPF